MAFCPERAARAALALCLAAVTRCALAQTPEPPPDPVPPRKVGVFLWHDSPNDRATLEGVRKGLRDAGATVLLELREAGSDAAVARRQLTELDAECELVLTLGTRATLLGKQHVQLSPVVFAAVTNPVTAGIVPDWNESSDGRLCGASNWIAPQSVLDVFRLAVPDLRRLGILRSKASGVVSRAELAGMREFLAREGAPDVAVHEAVVDDERGIADAVASLRAKHVQAIWIPIDLTIYQNVPAIERALGDRPLPLLTTAAAGVRNGALVGAAVDYRLHGRRAAAMVRRVLQAKGATQGLGVDRMRSSLVVANLDASRRLGVELPLSLLALADELIAPKDR